VVVVAVIGIAFAMLLKGLSITSPVPQNEKVWFPISHVRGGGSILKDGVGI
jgi:hypothetical protein